MEGRETASSPDPDEMDAYAPHGSMRSIVKTWRKRTISIFRSL